MVEEVEASGSEEEARWEAWSSDFSLYSVLAGGVRRPPTVGIWKGSCGIEGMVLGNLERSGAAGR